MSDDTHVPPGPGPGAQETSGTQKSPSAPEPSGEPAPSSEQKPGKQGKPAEPNVRDPGAQPEEPEPASLDTPAEESPAQEPSEDEPDERDERPYLERVADEERDWLRRQQNLSDLDGEETAARVGRDSIGRDSNRVSGGGSVFNAGRDVWISPDIAGHREPHVRYLPQSEAEQLKKCLVTPPSQAELKAALDRETLVFLRGAEGTGRRTSALEALLSWVGTKGGVVKDGQPTHVGVILTAGSLFPHSTPDLRTRHGYVLDATNTESSRDFGAIAENMKDLATKCGCRVVLLVPAHRSNLPARIVDHRPPAAPDVFRCWLKHEAGAAGVDACLLDEMCQEIDDDLNRESSPRQAYELANRLVIGLKAGKEPAELRAELPRQLRDGIRRRLDESGPVLGRCFMTSAAVLNGLQETMVSDAALAFAEHIKKVSSIKAEERLPAWEQLHTWLDYASATTSPAQVAGGGRILHLKRRAEIATLRVLWEDQPTIREPLIAWLKALAEEADQQQEVQMKAAHAAGILATFDFDIVTAKFLSPWSRSRKLRDHRLAAMMLESAARDPDLVPRVHDLLRKFADGSRGERLVTAHAYGSPIGLNAPSIALRDLRKIALGRDTEVGKAVAGSIGNLYSAETSEKILRALKVWVSSGSPGGLYTSALAFVRLAAIGSGNPARPPLIALESGHDLIEWLTVLWRNALSLRLITYRTQRSELVVPDSWIVLTRWVSRYDEEPVIRSVIDEIFGPAGIGPGRLRKAFILHLWQWEHQKQISRDLRERLIKLMKGG